MTNRPATIKAVPATPGPCTDRKSSDPGGIGGARRRAWGYALAAVVIASAAGGASAQRFPITPEQRDTAERVAGGVALADLAPNAPERYTIKRGDTLWGISTLFLKSPWRWPELWGMNREQIKNPHLIYPDQTLVLVHGNDGRVRLVVGDVNGAAPAADAGHPPPAPEERLPAGRQSPRVRTLGDSELQAISSIPNQAIEPFLTRPMVITAEQLAQYPRIVATQEDRVYVGVGDSAYARGIPLADDGITRYHVFRPAAPLYDPDDLTRRKPIAFEAQYLGSARVVRRGEVATLNIVESHQEIGVEDRLVPLGHQELLSYVPRRPDTDIAGRIIGVHQGVAAVGAGNIVTINRGSGDGLQVGHVLAVLHNGATVTDRTSPQREHIKLPDEEIGHIFVFRVFDHISYGLLVAASGPIVVGDRVGLPDAAPRAGEAALAAQRGQ